MSSVRLNGGLMKVKEQIIAEALDLFSTKGYDKTSISDICKASGSSRGGFYHHFQSKEDVLNAITDDYMSDFSLVFQKALKKQSGNQLDLFEKVFDTIIDFKIGQITEWNTLQKIFLFKGNHQIILKISRTFEKMVSEILEQVIREGNASKVFNCKYIEPLGRLWTREVMLLISEVQKDRVALNDLSQSTKDHIAFVEEILRNGLGVDSNLVNLTKKLEEYFNKMEGAQ